MLLVVLGIFGFMQTQRDLPARDLTILADEKGSGYYRVAEAYQAYFKKRGIDVEVRPTTGAAETLSQLQEGAAGIALVPGFMTADVFFLLPLVVLFGLLILYFPAIWRFYMQGKVLPVYKVLRKVEVDLPTMDMSETDAAVERLHSLEANVTQHVRVSAAYLPEVFHLRDHIRSVIIDLLRHKKALEALPSDDAARGEAGNSR